MTTHVVSWVLLLTLVVISGCPDVGIEPAGDELALEYIAGGIYADMMPVIPPVVNDRLGCFVDVLVRNKGSKSLHVEFRILQGELYRSGTRTRFGTLYFQTDWEGMLAGGEADTVRLEKASLSENFLQPECGASLRLDIELGESDRWLYKLSSDSLILGCVY